MFAHPFQIVRSIDDECYANAKWCYSFVSKLEFIQSLMDIICTASWCLKIILGQCLNYLPSVELNSLIIPWLMIKSLRWILCIQSNSISCNFQSTSDVDKLVSRYIFHRPHMKTSELMNYHYAVYTPIIVLIKEGHLWSLFYWVSGKQITYRPHGKFLIMKARVS